MEEEDKMYILGSPIEWVEARPERMITTQILDSTDPDKRTIKLSIPIPNIKVLQVKNIGATPNGHSYSNSASYE